MIENFPFYNIFPLNIFKESIKSFKEQDESSRKQSKAEAQVFPLKNFELFDIKLKAKVRYCGDGRICFKFL